MKKGEGTRFFLFFFKIGGFATIFERISSLIIINTISLPPIFLKTIPNEIEVLITPGSCPHNSVLLCEQKKIQNCTGSTGFPKPGA